MRHQFAPVIAAMQRENKATTLATASTPTNNATIPTIAAILPTVIAAVF
jgi:hypothetical protein